MSHKQHILVLSSWYPTRINEFLGNFVQRQARLFSSEHFVTVLHTKAEKECQSIELQDRVDGNFREVIVYHPKGKNRLQSYLFQKKAFQQGLQKISGISMIHSHVILPKGWQFIAAKKQFKCPLIVTEHASYYRNEIKEKRSFIERIILKKMVKKIDLLTAVSPFLRTDLQVEFRTKKIEILPNHIDNKLFTPTKKENATKKEFLHVSTLDEEVKNPKGIIDACQMLVARNKNDFHLTIVSDESTKKWEEYRNQCGLSEYISFHGPIEWQSLPPFYQQSDAFILFSDYETFSIVLGEAWACGIPTLTTSVGIGYNLSPDLGIQVERNSPKSLANAMEKIITNSTLFSPEIIQKYTEQFSSNAVLTQFNKLIKSIL